MVRKVRSHVPFWRTQYERVAEVDAYPQPFALRTESTDHGRLHARYTMSNFTLPGFRAALITQCGSTGARIRRGLQTQPWSVVRESIAWRTKGSGLHALPGLVGPIALVRDRRACVGRCRHRHQRQQE